MKNSVENCETFGIYVESKKTFKHLTKFRTDLGQFYSFNKTVFYSGKTCFSVLDYFSKIPEVARLESSSSTAVVY